LLAGSNRHILRSKRAIFACCERNILLAARAAVNLFHCVAECGWDPGGQPRYSVLNKGTCDLLLVAKEADIFAARATSIFVEPLGSFACREWLRPFARCERPRCYGSTGAAARCESDFNILLTVRAATATAIFGSVREQLRSFPCQGQL
jgi:hypothetical protein